MEQRVGHCDDETDFTENNINLDKQAYGHTDSRAFSSMFSGSGTIAEPLKRGQTIPANEVS